MSENSDTKILETLAARPIDDGTRLTKKPSVNDLASLVSEKEKEERAAEVNKAVESETTRRKEAELALFNANVRITRLEEEIGKLQMSHGALLIEANGARRANLIKFAEQTGIIKVSGASNGI